MLYTARIALDEGRDQFWLMEQWNMRSNYQAGLLLENADDEARPVAVGQQDQPPLGCQAAQQGQPLRPDIRPGGDFHLLGAQLLVGGKRLRPSYHSPARFSTPSMVASPISLWYTGHINQ